MEANMKISVVINTYNAEKLLEKVLESVKGFDEILICDMYSTDRTKEIAQKYNCTIVYHKKVNFVEPARNFAIQSATHEWILLLDADEIVQPALKDFLYEQIKRVNCPAGLYIPRKNYFMSHFMHSVYPDHLLRFFKKEKIYWPPYIHAIPTVQGKIEYIPSKRKDLAFIHLANDSVYTNLQKTNQYTENEPQKRKDKRYPFYSLLISPGFRFFKLYILKGGFRDGKAGLVYAGLNAFYKFVAIAKIWEFRTKENNIDKDLLTK